jgi:hypothetical protein
MATTQYNQLAIAYKKLSGKAHTNVDFGPSNETIGSGVQISALQTFGQDVSTTEATFGAPLGNTYTNASGETVVQSVRFVLSGIGTSLVATAAGGINGTSIDDTGETSAAASLYHAYALSLPDDYESEASYNHAKRGTFPFKAGQAFSGSNGRLQVIPSRFASGSTLYSSQFDPKVLKSDGSTEITPGDLIDWVFDPFAGVLYVQDPSLTTVPAYITAYLYIGNYVDEVISGISTSTGGGSGNYISSSNGDYIVSASNDGILIQGTYDTTPTNIANISTISASFSVPVVATSFTGSLQGTGSWARVAVSASIVDNTVTNVSYYPVFVTAAGNQGLQIDTSTLSYNPSTNILTTTASSAATASNISTAFVGSTVAPNNQILISNGTGQVTGSSLLSFNPATDGGQLTIGNVTIDQNSFNSTSNTFDFGFGSGPGNASYIQITNANNPSLATIQFNLSASFTGPSTFANSINSTFDDQFILLASGSANVGGDKDSGIVFEYGSTVGTGSALFFDHDTKRLAFRYSASVANTAMAPQAYVNMTFVQGIDVGITSTSDIESKFTAAGGNTSELVNDMKGFMFIDTNGNIYIKA